jgi:hypothetical protein
MTFMGVAAAGNEKEVSMYKWIGLGIVIGSAILSNLGVNVQKLSHVRVSCHHTGHKRKSFESYCSYLV